MIWWYLGPAGVLCLAALTLAVIPSYAGMTVPRRRRKYYVASILCTLAGAALLLMTVV